jgi:hypothetical protein
MLFALRQPATLLGLLLGFGAAAFALALAQGLVAGTTRNLRTAAPARIWLDPYGAVAALLAGVGWAARPEIQRRFGRDPRRTAWLIAVVAVAVPAVLAAAGYAGYLAAGGSRSAITFLGSIGVSSGSVTVLHGSQPIAQTFGQRVTLGFAMECLAMSLLSVVPIPPLATGVAVWSQFPRTPGSRRLAYHLLEEQWGIAVILVFTLIPLVGQEPALLALIGTISDDILRALG